MNHIAEDYTKYVDVFYGNGEIDLPKPEGIAKTWQLLKGLCGNTSPAAALPFGKFTCGPYSGGYPTGYGNHLPNSCGAIRKFDGKLRGFSHLQHSGVGGAGIYYNYVLVTPFYGQLSPAEYDYENEKASPGYYSVKLDNNIFCELTMAEEVAFHRYTFKKRGKVSINLASEGLSKLCEPYLEKDVPSQARICLEDKNSVSMEVTMRGVDLFFYIEFDGANARLWRDYKEIDSKEITCTYTKEQYGIVFEGEDVLQVRVSISAKSLTSAKNQLKSEKRSFDEVRSDAQIKWNQYLSAIEIDADEKTKSLFYSNFYHTLTKPSNWNGESFLYDGGPFYCDFVTIWDIYKTQLPLIASLYKKESEDIFETLLRLGEEKGYTPINLMLVNSADRDRMQARMLAEMYMADFYYRHKPADVKRILAVTEKELDYWKDKKTSYVTHLLDMAEACASISDIAEKEGYPCEKLRNEALLGQDLFDKKTGLLPQNSAYYEGDEWNYSFRLCHDMEKRVELAGGKEKFTKYLDEFFGFTREPVNRYTELSGYEFMEALEKVHSFEGFNNETDMETPYAYFFAGRHDKLCEVVRAGMKYMYTTGRGGIPGNNDSGALSSCYMWNAMGIFPVSGQDMMLIGSPIIKKASIHLANGKDFDIEVHGDGIYVDKAILNGQKLSEMCFSVTKMMEGGTLSLYMK